MFGWQVAIWLQESKDQDKAMLTIGKVLRALGKDTNPRNCQEVVTGGCIDSRQATQGSLFVALAGEQTDGHLYVDQAFEGGAVLALVEHQIDSAYHVFQLDEIPDCLGKLPFSVIVPNTLAALQTVAAWWRAQFDIPVIGVTGSVGKSSTKEAMSALLGYKFRVLKNKGNMNNEIGLPLTLLSLNENHQAAVLEMGFYVPGEIKLLCKIAKPRIGVVTNIGTVHAERAGNIETIARGKSELVQALPVEGLAVLNNDDLLVRAMADNTSARILTYGTNPEADLWADKIQSKGLEGISFLAHYAGQSHPITSELLGKHSVYNLLSSIAVALELGFSWIDIEEALRTQEMVQRIRILTSHTNALVLDDSYNASPSSTVAALDLLDEMEGEKIAVLGDMLELGQYETEGHQQVGRKAAHVAQKIVLVGPLSLLTRDAILDTGFPEDKVRWFTNSEEAAQFLQENLKAGQVVLVKGSHGMRMDKIIAALEEKI